MRLSEIAFALVLLLSTAGFLHVVTTMQKHFEEEIAKLRSQLQDLRVDYLALSGELSDLDSKVTEFMRDTEDHADVVAKQQEEIRKWNEGISNIMNYSLDVAKGGGK